MRDLFGDEEEQYGRRWRKIIRCLWFIIRYNRSLHDLTVSFKKKIEQSKIKDLIRPMVDFL